MYKICEFCRHTFKNKYLKNTDLQIFSTEVCSICNEDVTKTLILNAYISDPVISDYIYSETINKMSGKDILELPKIGENEVPNE